MGYVGNPLFKQQELTSVKRMRESTDKIVKRDEVRLREYGVSGMKWGSKKDEDLHKELGRLADHASEEGLTGSASKIENIMKKAEATGKYSDSHLDRLGELAEKHGDKSYRASSGSAQEKDHNYMSEGLGKALDNHADAGDNEEKQKN